MFEASGFGGRMFGQFANAFLAAETASQKRYDYAEATLNFRETFSGWRISAAIDGLQAEDPELVLYFPTDHQDLVDNDRLVPLTEFLAGDAEFDPAAFWPGVLEAAQTDGRQMALPVSVSPHVVLFNTEAARAVDLLVPEPDLRSFDRATFLAAALAMNHSDAAGQRAGRRGFVSAVRPEPRSNGDYVVSPSPVTLLTAALGPLKAPDGSFKVLETEQAIDAVQFMRELVTTYELTVVGDPSIRSVIRNRRYGMAPTALAFVGFRELSHDSIRVYPFPDLGSGRNPAVAWGLLGILKSSRDVTSSYQALRFLEQALSQFAIFPARRVPPATIHQRLPDLSQQDAEVVVNLLNNAIYTTPSRREVGIINNGIARDVQLGSVSAKEALRAIVQQLEAALAATPDSRAAPALSFGRLAPAGWLASRRAAGAAASRRGLHDVDDHEYSLHRARRSAPVSRSGGPAIPPQRRAGGVPGHQASGQSHPALGRPA